MSTRSASRHLQHVAALATLLLAGSPTWAGPPRPVGPVPAARPAPPAARPPGGDITPADRRVHAYLEGRSRVMDIDEARSYGFTIVDLSDDWVPYIFWSRTPGRDDEAENTYQRTYIDLANDRVDVDGAPLRPRERNYLGVFGIPPTLGVLRRRLLEESARPCFRSLNYAVFREYHGPVRVVDVATSKRAERLYYSARANYLDALKKARVRTLDQLLAKPAYRAVARRYRKYRWWRDALRAMYARLKCEGLFRRHRPRVKPGFVDWAVRGALKRFERKNRVFGWGMIFEKTARALGRTPEEAIYDAVRRVVAERVASAAGILEDGTARTRFTGADGKVHETGDLIGRFTDATLAAMGITGPEAAAAFLRARGEGGFRRLFIAVKLPPVPEYYADQMDLSVVIDRGDVWYDPPFDARGRRIRRSRRRFPTFTLYTRYRGQRIPLVRWRTTIGSWQSELRNGEVYYKYKMSDVGPRIWRNIVAGPVWVPPRSTPANELTKVRWVNGKTERVVSQSTFGPGYASAYGLVAAFHVRPRDGFDNQIRTHGTVNYMSILSRYSHGCHRLFNHLAVRMFSFVLRHRAFKRKGQTRLAYQHRFEYRGEEFQINLHTRGYYYELTPPVPVNVLEGRIIGQVKEPVADYVKKPTVVYQDDIGKAAARSRRPSAAPRVKKPARANPLAQQQTL